MLYKLQRWPVIFSKLIPFVFDFCGQFSLDSFQIFVCVVFGPRMAHSDTDSNLSFYGFRPINVVFRGEMAHMNDVASEQSGLSISEVNFCWILFKFFVYGDRIEDGGQ